MRNNKGRIDSILLMAAMAISFLGIVFVYSATHNRSGDNLFLNPMAIKQCMWCLVGFVLLFLIARADYLRMLDMAYLAYGLNLVALLFLLFFGDVHYGAKRWIDLGPIAIQPSEFVKITAILALAAFLGERRERTGSFSNFVLGLGVIMPAFLLIFLQPDLGTSLVLIPIVFAVLYVCGEKIKYIIPVIVAGICSTPFLWSLLKDYQKNRLLVFLNPDLDPLGAGYTIIQSKIAIGSGGLLGKGLFNGTQSYLKFLPEKHTDFIFSVIGEEWGYVGAATLLFLYTVLIARGLRIISKTEDVCGKAIATGIVTLIAFQVFVNIAMTIGFMPVVGLPLPAISYGGSNTIVTLIGVGFLLSISRKVE